MPSTLSVQDNRRSRSKSPGGGRDRDRSHSRDTRAKSPPKRESRRPSKKYPESESESESEEEDRRSKRSNRKYYDDPASEDDRRRKSSSKKYSSEEEETRRKSSKSSKKYYDDDSDDRDRRPKKESREPPRESRESRESRDHREAPRESKSSRRKDDSDDDKRRNEKSKPSSRKKVESETESSGSEDINISIHRKSKTEHKEKYLKDERENGRQVPYAPPPPGYGYPPPPQGYLPDPRIAPDPRMAPDPRLMQDPRLAYQNTRHGSYVEPADPRYGPPPPDPYFQGHSDIPDHQRTHSISTPSGRYSEPNQYQYAQTDPNIAYKSRDPKQYIKTYNQNGQAQLVEAQPEKFVRQEKKLEKKYSDDKFERREKKYHDDHYGTSPDDTTRKLSMLAVGGGLGAGLAVAGARKNSHDGDRPPASPLLEAYKGTYQSISPMPSALVLANHKHDSDISDLDMSHSESESEKDELKKKIRMLEKEKQRHSKERAKEEKEIKKIKYERDRGEVDVAMMVVAPSSKRKKVSFYDPIPDAKKIAAALAGTHSAPNTKPLIQILPDLSSDDLFALRAEYKNHAKIGGQGINMTKHIKMRVPGNLGKAVYATSLGRWESEAYWANSWYQGGASRRELLIESLMGRSNSDIHEIKNCFKDKRYNDDLEKCMKAELKADKFRVAILLALEEQRMAEGLGMDLKLVALDVADLHRALVGREGGETAMIQIIVVRSDSHLREVLRLFERKYEMNFAKEMISKSRNLVGETLAHILNGALNRGMRDALLLHQAISETAPGKERAELLISRLVRLHWEPKHLERVKIEFEKRYRMPVDLAIKREVVDLAKTEEGRQWGEFCVELARSSGR